MKAPFARLSACLPAILALALLPPAAPAQLPGEDEDDGIDPFGAVVKLEVVSRESDFVNPWPYTIEVEEFTITEPSGSSTVACLSAATMPTAPAVDDNCGNALTPSDTTIVDSPNPLTCEGTRTYTFTYTDCEGNQKDWTYTYTIEVEEFTITTAPGSSTVACLSAATMPTAPAVEDNCGNALTRRCHPARQRHPEPGRA